MIKCLVDSRNKPILGLILDLAVSGISLPGLGLGDIERKAIYFNQGLPAQLLTIVRVNGCY